jgi:hypothetical protein
MPAIISSGPVHCSVCGGKIPSGEFVVCEHCGSEFHFFEEGGPLFKRGSTPVGHRVVELLISRFNQAHQIDLAAEPLAMQRVIEASEHAARELTTKGKTVVNLPFITAGPSGPLHLEMKLKKADLG